MIINTGMKNNSNVFCWSWYLTAVLRFVLTHLRNCLALKKLQTRNLICCFVVTVLGWITGYVKLLPGTWILIWVVGFCMNLQSVHMWYCHCSSYVRCLLLCLLWTWPLRFLYEVVDLVHWKYQTRVCRLNILLTRFLDCVIFLELRGSNVILARSDGTVRLPLLPTSWVAQVLLCSLRACSSYSFSSRCCSFELRFVSLNIFFFRVPEICH
jgi:hypothetical protein